MDKAPNKKIVSVNFICALFSLLDFLILEDGIEVVVKRSVKNSYLSLYNICLLIFNLSHQLCFSLAVQFCIGDEIVGKGGCILELGPAEIAKNEISVFK